MKNRLTNILLVIIIVLQLITVFKATSGTAFQTDQVCVLDNLVCTYKTPTPGIELPTRN